MFLKLVLLACPFISISSNPASSVARTEFIDLTKIDKVFFLVAPNSYDISNKAIAYPSLTLMSGETTVYKFKGEKEDTKWLKRMYTQIVQHKIKCFGDKR